MGDHRIVAAAEPAGSHHYRSFVGPPERYDLVGSGQFALLHLLGLRDYHRVLDFGCGSLRLGRLLIPFLQKGGYFGIEPNFWLVDEGFSQELGHDAKHLKSPTFSRNADFSCNVFEGQEFDYVVAQSIFTHTGMAQAKTLIRSIAEVLTPLGLGVFNFKVGTECSNEAHETDWKYPGILSYTEEEIRDLTHDAGLEVRPVSWPHPGPVRWFVAAKSARSLPNAELLSAMDIVPHVLPD